ncbi:MAG: multiubiquitin domain-containing protein [Candidatus Rokubacteria bacterium]|nr:multiubiquitin domain-containing protein [Candidatus Rokubacteria bacterium]
MPRVVMDGQEFDIPAGTLTGRDLKRLAGADPEDVVYRVAAPGEAPEVLDDDLPVQLRDGDQVGRTRPFLAGG